MEKRFYGNLEEKKVFDSKVKRNKPNPPQTKKFEEDKDMDPIEDLIVIRRDKRETK